MSTISPVQSGIQGIQSGMQNLKQDAQEIASNGTTKEESSNLQRPLIDLVQDKNEVASATKVVKAADETIGTLVDVMA